MSNRFANSARTVILAVLEDLDLYILVVAALAFTALGAYGYANTAVLLSVLLALLAVLAISQVRSRRQVAQIAQSVKVSRTAPFLHELPPSYTTVRSQASDRLLIGMSMGRTIQGARNDIRRVLVAGGRVRVCVFDPSNEALMKVADYAFPVSLSPDQLRARITVTLSDLASLSAGAEGRLELRVTGRVLPARYEYFERNDGSVIYVIHAEYRSKSEPQPVVVLDESDGFWFRHFVDEAEKIWNDANRWPSASSS